MPAFTHSFRIYSFLLVLVRLLTAQHPLTAQGWSQQFGSPGATTTASTIAVAVDGAGNVYCTGYISNNAITSFGTLTTQGTHDAYLAKFDSQGNPVSIVQAGTSGTQASGTAVGFDSNGNLYWLGNYQKSITLNGTVLTPGGSFLVKYTAQGQALWTRAINGGLDKMCIDGSGAVYLAGSDPSSNIVKIDAQGTTVWSNPLFPSNYYNVPYCTGITLDTNNQLWVAARGFILPGGPRNAHYVNSLARYSSQGVLLNSIQPPDEVNAMTSASNGNVYIISTPPASPNASISAYNSQGALLWTNPFSTQVSPSIYNLHATIGPSGNVYVTGVYSGNLTVGNTTITGPTNTSVRSFYNGFVAALTSQGIPIGVVRTSQNSNNTTGSQMVVAFGPQQEMYLAGSFSAPLAVPGIAALSNRGLYDGYVARLGSVLLSTNSANAPANALVVYPNPALRPTALHIELAGLPAQLRLCNALGQIVREEMIAAGNKTTTFSTIGLVPGPYVLQARYSTGIVTRSIVLE